MLQFRQLTFGDYGHTLNRRQSISPDKEWVVYDTRNEDAHISRTHSIEQVRFKDCVVQSLYQTKSQSEFGPGVGAVAYHPTKNRICFIHGLENCNADRPYSSSRRFGALLDTSSPGIWAHAESRCINKPGIRTLGILSGGTHAHSWNVHDWISFTYNDYFLERDSALNPHRRNLRTVGFMYPWNRGIKKSEMAQDEENFLGTYAAFLAARVTPSAPPGSDAIEQAVEECWIGNLNALAFQGTVRDERGQLHQEVFRCDLPNEAILDPLVSTTMHMDQAYMALEVIPNITQRRLTFTTQRRYPGIQGPRHWLVASSDAKFVYFIAKDDQGLAQLFRVAAQGGMTEQISDLPSPIEGQISIDASSEFCYFVSRNRICRVQLERGAHEWLTEDCNYELTGAVHVLRADQLVVNGYVGNGDTRRLQIFVCK